MQTNHSIQKNAGELLLGILVFTLIISVMNATMFNVALPIINNQFQLSPSQGSWIITGYMIVYAIGSVTYGKLTDRYSLKNLLTFGLLFFAMGSVVGLVATQYWMVIVGRIVQAAGAAVIPAVTMIVPVRYFSPERRGRALGTVAIGYALGLALGPIIAGVVSSTWNWRVLFVISLLSLFTLPMYRKYLEDEKGVASKMDFIGGSLLAGTVALLLLALTQENIWLAAAGAISFILFLLRIRLATAPFIDPAIFRNKPFSFGLIITFVMIGISFAIPFVTPQLLSSVNHLSPVFIGMVMLPSAIMAAILGRRGGKLADEKGNPFLVYTAAALLIIGFVCLSSVVGMSPVFIAIFLIFGVLGQSFMQIAMSNTVSRALPKEHIGVGMGLFSMITFISSAASAAAIAKVLDFGTSTVHFNPIPQNSTTFVYSDIFLVLAILVVMMVALYYVQFGRAAKMAKDRVMDSKSVT
ncbi:MFS transporter [Paenibacillus sp. OAS669]|uniref:MFS transporter n=1 Tax=Paenibacillus sp. OAS669 TaxID=2663821 RepID=UPI00178A93C3|nr:MFS transporter [Paenibacillus sp. OAS669]MBE1444587.1 DHA2 family metal-tetracycline-proton antiporter-like MFS transporter [Paenibacillus sp. OAS669]